MAKQMSEEEIYELARKRVKEKKSFYSNLGSWFAVNVVLIIIWLLTENGGYMWFLWPLCIWGFFVLLNFFQVFVFPGTTEKSAIEKEAEKLRKG
ncbi:2TM domain-containing protein [Chloroflexota bacterium]